MSELVSKVEMTERRAGEARKAEELKHNEEIAFLKKTNQQLKVFQNGVPYKLSIAMNKLRAALVYSITWYHKCVHNILGTVRILYYIHRSFI